CAGTSRRARGRMSCRSVTDWQPRAVSTAAIKLRKDVNVSFLWRVRRVRFGKEKLLSIVRLGNARSLLVTGSVNGFKPSLRVAAMISIAECQLHVRLEQRSVAPNS